MRLLAQASKSAPALLNLPAFNRVNPRKSAASLRGNGAYGRVALVMVKNSIKTSPIDMEARAKIEFASGDNVRVWSKIQEKGKTRLQAFEGLVLSRKHGKEAGAMFTVRRVSSGVGVERIFPLYSPNIDKIEIIKKSKTRKSKLYYVREKAAKEIRRKMKQSRMVTHQDGVAIVKEAVVPEPKVAESTEAK